MPFMARLTSLERLELSMGGDVSAAEISYIQHLPIKTLSLYSYSTLPDGSILISPELVSAFAEMTRLRKLQVSRDWNEALRHALNTPPPSSWLCHDKLNTILASLGVICDFLCAQHGEMESSLSSE